MAEWHMAVTPQEHKCQICKSRVSQDSHCLGVKGAPKAGFSGETEGWHVSFTAPSVQYCSLSQSFSTAVFKATEIKRRRAPVAGRLLFPVTQTSLWYEYQ
jgi:hypothetical protein